MLVILPNVWYRCIYIYIFWGKSKHTHVCVQTHTISYMHVRLQICVPINMETYPQKQSLYCLILYTCMFLFRLKRLMLQKGKSKCFSRHSRDNISGAWSQIRPGKHCSTYRNSREIKIYVSMLNCQLTENKSFKFIRMGRISINMGNSLCFVISLQILHYCFWVSGYLQCVTVVIPGSETWMPNQCLW